MGAKLGPRIVEIGVPRERLGGAESGQKNKGAWRAPVSRKYLEWNGLGLLLALLRALLGGLLRGLLLGRHLLCHLLLADWIDRAGKRVLACLSLEGRGLATPGSVDCRLVKSGSTDVKESGSSRRGVVTCPRDAAFFSLCEF